LSFEEEKKILTDYIQRNNLKISGQKLKILDSFLSSKKHITAEELYGIIKKKHKSIGIATVYRTLKLLCDSGICRILKLDDGVTRYEALYGHEHHDHLICANCGKVVEVYDKKIEELQLKIAKKHHFILKNHRLDMYGICSECKKKRIS